jgi:uncharacterized protein YkwD
MLAGGAASTNAATPVGHAPVVVAAPITTSALVGPAPAVREWSDCLVSTVNAARATAGAPPLKLELRVSLAAFGHSLDQAAAQTMSHSDGARTDGGMRLQAAGYSWSTWGENVAAGQADCEAVTAAWLGSSTHRANILNPQFRDVGFGMAIGANGVPYWTMDLAAG